MGQARTPNLVGVAPGDTSSQPPLPRALIHSLYQGKRAEEGRVPSPKGIVGVQSTSRSRPGPCPLSQGRHRACGSGSRVILGLFVQSGLSRGSGDLPLCWEGQGCLWPGAVSLYAGVLVCVWATLAVRGAVLDGRRWRPPPSSQGGPHRLPLHN